MCRSTANSHSVSLDIAVICKNLNPALATQSQALTPETESKASSAKWTGYNYYSYCQPHYCKAGGQRA